MTKKILTTIAFLTGLGLIFIGTRFLIAPETAEAGYGIRFNEHTDYSFHYIKGIRDLFSGLVICILALGKQTKALGIVLLTGTIIPITDMLIVLGKDDNGITQAVPHISAIIVCLFCGLFFLTRNRKQEISKDHFIKIIQSADTNKESIIEFNISPNERTPWHYHTLFSETFEVLKGTLNIGLNHQIYELRQGNSVTVPVKEKHYFHNTSNEECLIKVTIAPGNKNFEKALLISTGLAKDGLASATGIPKRISDLALFIYLNNSKMAGPQKIAEPLFNYLAKVAIKKGYLKELEHQYCETNS